MEPIPRPDAIQRAREEKLRKRNAEMAKKSAEDARMAKLYREVVLKEKPVEAGFVPLDSLGGIKPALEIPRPPHAPLRYRVGFATARRRLGTLISMMVG